jgi:hypothetical protein
MVVAAKFTRLTHKIAIQLHLLAESSTIYSSHSRLPLRKLVDTPTCIHLVPRLRMRGGLPSAHHTPLWRGAALS